MLETLFKAAADASREREKLVSYSSLVDLVSSLGAPRNIYAALAPTDRVRLIAEIKRASPSKGYLAEIPDPAQMAISYEQSGADAVSVLTEETGFLGKLEDLVSVSNAVSIPTLRKDFISNEYQILEARKAGASFILLILSYLNKEQVSDLFRFAEDLGMGVLVEAHTETEIETAGDLGCRLIGINTRDLKTFRTDIGLFEKLANRLPTEVIRVAESSVRSIEDVQRYRAAGAHCVLVGEALVTGDYRKLIPQIVSVA